MPKIKPETKVLIIKTLKSKTPAEVADIFNVSKWQVERICKHYQETGDVYDRPRLGRPGKTTAQDDSLLVRLSKVRPMSTASQLQEWTPATPVSSRTVRRLLARNGLHGCIAAQKPVLNKRQVRNHLAYAKADSLTEGGTAEKWQKIFFRRIVSCAPSQAPPILSMTIGGPSGPKVHPEDSQIWSWKDYGLGLHPIRRCQGDL